MESDGVLAELRGIRGELARIADALDAGAGSRTSKPASDAKADLSLGALRALAVAIRGKVGNDAFLAAELVRGIDTAADLALVKALAATAPGEDPRDVAKRLGNALSEASKRAHVGGFRVERAAPERARGGTSWRVIAV